MTSPATNDVAKAEARERPGFLSRYCIAQCTSRSCDSHGDCPALAFLRRQTVAGRLGEVAQWLGRNGPATTREIVEGVFLDDIPALDQIPEWQHIYLIEQLDRALLSHLRRLSSLFLRVPGTLPRWRVPREPELSRLAQHADILLVRAEEGGPAALAVRAVRDADAPLSLPELLEQCEVTPTAPDYGAQLRVLEQHLRSPSDIRCVFSDPLSGLGWRWWIQQRIPAVPTDIEPARDADEATNDGTVPERLRITVRRRHILTGILPVGRQGRALFPVTPVPAYITLVEVETGQPYPAWYDPATARLFQLHEFYLLNSVEYGAQLGIEPLETAGLFSVEIAGVDEVVRERDIRARDAGWHEAGQRGRRSVPDVVPEAVLAGELDQLWQSINTVVAEERELDQRLGKIEALLASTSTALGGGVT